MEADKKEKTRHNQFIKTAQPYKPKVKHLHPGGGGGGGGQACWVKARAELSVYLRS